MPRYVRQAVAVVALFGVCFSGGMLPAYAATSTLTVSVRDARDGKVLTGARLVVDGKPATSSEEPSGTYEVQGLPPGRHDVRVEHDGYRPATVTIDVPGTRSIALYANNASTDLTTIAQVHASSNASGAGGMTLNTTIGSVDLDKTATFRLADALLNLPELSASAITASATNTSPTSGGYATPLMGGPGSYVQMSIRGFGTIESPTLIDGHPIGQGVDLGFDFQDAPTFGLSSVFVGYGSDAALLYGVGGAGVIDMRTLSPTTQPVTDVLQGLGSYGRAATALKSTGSTTNGFFGWAFTYGVEGTGGPLNGSFYAPTASLDPSNPKDISAATYAFSDDTNRRNFLGKFRFRLGSDTTLTLKGFNATAWADGSGDNADGIYKTAPVATAQGQQLLQASPPSNCPAGTFLVYSQLLGPSGNPLPQSVPCQTPQQYGAFNTGFQGIGPHYVGERVSDYGATLSTTAFGASVNLDFFTNSYYWNYDRGGALPYSDPQYPFGQLILPYLSVDQLVVNTGETLTIDDQLGNNHPYIAIRALNNSNRFSSGPSITSPVVASSSFAFGDHWSADGGRIEIDAGGAFEANDATADGSAFDPHIAASLALSKRDRIRVSAASSTIIPAALWLDAPFAPNPLGTFQASINCSSPNSVGSVPSSALLPERIGDQEITYNHDWGGGAFTTLDVYDARLSNKIYAATVPVSSLPANTVPDAELAPYRNALIAQCNNDSTLAASGNFNIGAMRAMGADLLGRLPIPGVRHLALDYSYSTLSSVLGSVNTPWFLPFNLSFIPGAQTPGVPVHTGSLDLDYTLPRGIDATFRRYWVGANNPSNLPAYAYSDLVIGLPIAPNIRAHVMLDNLFNENAGWYALAGVGYPSPLNHYATAANYALYSGYAATTLAPLSPRTFLITIDFRH
jgi:hypothetical protein